ncbi:MAG: DUF3488 domain-containing transglutaminase family protein [Proteobacteria bacterium]|nr:DUF3488 domain-containing transglutaminase family protein [Pseudomonadota bacterium]
MAKPAPVPLELRSKLWSLAAALACALPLLRLLPGWLALALLGLSALATIAGWKRTLPLPLRLLLTFAFIVLVLYAYRFGIGRDSGSALLLAMLLLKPVELSSLRDARAVVGFALFAPFAAVLLDQGPLTLALAVPGAVLALVACARLADAEVGLPVATFDRRRAMAMLGLFALAVPLALASFWFFPRLGSPLWGLPNAAKAKLGIADDMAPGDWLDVLTDDTPAFRVRFDGAVPRQPDLYWRGLVMWDFDGRSWRQPNWPQELAPATMAAGGRPTTYTVSLEPTGKRYVFALDLPESAPAGTNMAQDRSMRFDAPVDGVRAYRVTSAHAIAFEAELDPRIRALALRLPADYDPRTRALAGQWRAQGADDVQIVQRALAMFHDRFSYSLAAPPLGRDSVDEFLFDTRIGFCEHFSSSFTFLMRAAGIPARVVTGYVGGYNNRLGNFLLVRQSDAHAWSEVWLQGRGWVRVDPTAAVAPERVFRHGGQFDSGPGGNETAAGRLFDVGDWLRYGWNRFVLGFDATRQLALLRALGVPDPDTRTLAAIFAVVVGALLSIIGAFQWRQRGRPVDRLDQAWAQFTRELARAGLGKLAHEPALAWARRIAPELAAQGAPVLSLSVRFADARYARGALDASARQALIGDLRAFKSTQRHPS